MKYAIGDTIRIIDMLNEPQYNGKSGKIDYIDSLGQLFGSWGGCAVIPEADKIELLERGAQ